MLDVDFLLLLNDFWVLYLLSLSISLASIYYIPKKYTHSWIDPLRLAFIYVVFANAIPLFLFFTGDIAKDDFLYFIFSELFFWIGFLLFARKNIHFNKGIIINSEAQILYSLFIIFFILFVLFTLATYTLRGIPLFLESRLSLYQGSGGLGLLGRINSYLSIFCLICSFYYLKSSEKKKHYLAKIVLVTIALTFVLSGSKSAFFTVLTSYYCFSYYYIGAIPSLKKIGKYILMAAIAAILVLYIPNIEQGRTFLSSTIALGYRFIASGDIYWMAYPGKTYEVVELGDKFNYLLQGFLGPLRLIDISQVEPALGLQLNWFVSPLTGGEISGPNARLPVLSYLLFGNLGVVFSLLIGMILSLILFRLPSFLPKGILSTIFFTYVYMKMIAIITDLSLAIGYVFDVLVTFSLTYFFSVLILLIEGGIRKR